MSRALSDNSVTIIPHSPHRRLFFRADVAIFIVRLPLNRPTPKYRFLFAQLAWNTKMPTILVLQPAASSIEPRSVTIIKLTRFSVIYTLPRLLLLIVLVGTFGCSSASYIQTKVTDNPLDRVAQQAQKDWSVERVDDNTLHLSDAWPMHSVFSLGYSASHAKLFYVASDSALNIQYYFQSNQLFSLFIPMYLDAEPGFVGGALKPIMNDQINDILKWSGASVVARRSGHHSDPFPSRDVTASTPK